MNENKIYNESCLDTLGRMPDNYLDCCVTSPPYWGLRDYGLQPSIWDAQDGCLHEWGNNLQEHHPGQVSQTKWSNNTAVSDGQTSGSGRFCTKCSAWRGNLGLEPTPELYVHHIVSMFHEIKRALKPEGTVWLNLGDTYCGSGGPGGDYDRMYKTEEAKDISLLRGKNPNKEIKNLKPKDLVGIPWRVAFALQADGWYLRSDIIWHKPNPMPESVTDRPTKSHEYIFLLTKSSKYYYDADAIREPHQDTNRPNGFTGKDGIGDRSINQGWSGGKVSLDKHRNYNPLGRNKRSVWTVNTQPFPGAHFAVFPPELIVPCIKAGCPKDGIVYDPFGGAATTALVALRAGRKFICSELNPQYVKIGEKRIKPLLNQGDFFYER